ncbi:MAG: biotin--[acetyl-CoA-carboxylase] ligase [Planctomycetota bacterium]
MGGENRLGLAQIGQVRFLAGVEYCAVLGSTNDRALELARAGQVPTPYLVVAEEQTAGRGQGSNRWWTGQGSLAFSLLLGDESLPAARSARQMTALAAALAIVEVVARRLTGREVGLRWPNDVYCEQRKLAGILVEVLPDGRQVLGIGLNVNNTLTDAPPELQQCVATLRDLTDQTHDRTAVLVELLGCLREKLAMLNADPAAVAAEADRLCLQRSQVLRVQAGDRLIEGECGGIAADGALRLKTSQGWQAVYSGTVLRG